MTYTIICRDKYTRIITPQICDGETEFAAVYKFRHEHEQYDILDIQAKSDKPYIFPTFRSVALFVVALCIISLFLFPVIIFAVKFIFWLYEKIY